MSVYLNLSQGNIRQIAMLMFMCSKSSSAHKNQNAFSYHRIGNDKERSFTGVNVYTIKNVKNTFKLGPHTHLVV